MSVPQDLVTRERLLVAGCIYFLIVYAFGFAMGIAREFLITPRTGLTLALWIELPVMAAASFWATQFVVLRFGVKRTLRDRLMMGISALAMLIVAEEMMSWALRGISIFTVWAHFSVLAGLANFAGLLLFAIMPLLVRGHDGQRKKAERA